MFITYPQFRQFLPPALYGRDKEGHRAVALSMNLPWFLFTIAVPSEGGKIFQTMLVAWESTLLEVLDAVKPEDRIGISLFTSTSELPATWSLTPVEEIWQPSPLDDPNVGPLLYKFAGHDSICDDCLQSCGDVKGRVLVFASRATKG